MPRKAQKQRGFTLIETMVAIVVLTIGLMSVAALMSQMVGTSAKSRYMTVASVLATEKLEDLSRYKNSDINVAAGGSLVGTPAGYSDVVEISSGNGSISETANGNTITHLPNGTITPAAAPLGADTIIFNRNWVIVADTPVLGVRQITVLVTMANGAIKPAVKFQTSAVRP